MNYWKTLNFIPDKKLFQNFPKGPLQSPEPKKRRVLGLGLGIYTQTQHPTHNTQKTQNPNPTPNPKIHFFWVFKILKLII